MFIKKEIVDDKHEPEIPETPITVKGMVWLLGKHRLMCGDSTKMDDMAVLMAGNKADCIWTDPPYGVSYTEKNDYLNKERAGIEHRAIEGNDLRGQDLEDFLVKAFQVMATNIKDCGCIYVAHADSNTKEFRLGMELAKFYVSQTLIWVKNCPVLSRNDYNWKHEPILYGWKKGEAHYYGLDFTQTTVIDHEVDINTLSKEKLIEMVEALKDLLQLRDKLTTLI
ncbi:MAG: DNA methyltransferase [Desulfomonilia bacterium]|jgi:DNA modification methylase